MLSGAGGKGVGKQLRKEGFDTEGHREGFNCASRKVLSVGPPIQGMPHGP
jgi:hypothetical protein